MSEGRLRTQLTHSHVDILVPINMSTKTFVKKEKEMTK